METAFGEDKKLSEINIDPNNAHYMYENGILMHKDGTTIVFVVDSILKSKSTFTIPDGLKTFAFNISSYSNIKKIEIPATLTNIDIVQLPSSIETIVIANGNQSYCVENSCLYTKDLKQLVLCYSKEENISLNNNVAIIKRHSFRTAVNATNIVLPDSVTTIEDQVFTKCQKLNQLILGKNVKSIDPIFKYTNYAGTVTIDEGNPYYTIKDNVLYNKDMTTLVAVLHKINGKYVVDSQVQTLGSRAFHYQPMMEEVELPNALKNINNSFNYCTGLTKIEIPSSIQSIDSGTFSDASNLKEIIIHKEENSISGAPWGCQYGLRAIKWQP